MATHRRAKSRAAAPTTSLTYAHDASGALTKKGENHLHYGVDGRIAKVGLSADANQTAMVNYTYNLLSQRLLKRDSRLSSVTPVTEYRPYMRMTAWATPCLAFTATDAAHTAQPLQGRPTALR